MNTTNWTERLSEYLDGSLTPAEQAECEAWLSRSAEGRALLEELRMVMAKAKTIPDLPVPASVWAGISAGIKQQPLVRSADVVPIGAAARSSAGRSRRWSLSPLQLAIAAAALLAVGIWFGTRVRTAVRPPVAVIPASDQGLGTPVNNPERLGQRAEVSYDRAIADLQIVLQHNRSNLDTATVRVLESSLARIDAAIADAQKALDADPSSAYLNDHLSRIKRKKLDLLRQGTSLARAS